MCVCLLQCIDWLRGDGSTCSTAAAAEPWCRFQHTDRQQQQQHPSTHQPTLEALTTALPILLAQAHGAAGAGASLTDHRWGSLLQPQHTQGHSEWHARTGGLDGRLCMKQKQQLCCVAAKQPHIPSSSSSTTLAIARCPPAAELHVHPSLLHHLPLVCVPATLSPTHLCCHCFSSSCSCCCCPCVYCNTLYTHTTLSTHTMHNNNTNSFRSTATPRRTCQT